MAQLTKDAVLELDIRRKIYDTLVKSPGLHFRELQRRVDIAYGALQYHLEFMIKHHLIEEEKGKEYARFFPTGFRCIQERKIISLLRQKTIRHLLLYLLEQPHAKHKDLVASLNLSPSTISWHIARLIQSGAVIEEKGKNETHYVLSEPEIITRLLVTYKASFIDKIVDRFVDAWEKESPRSFSKSL